MTDEELLRRMDEGELDTKVWSDALEVARFMLEDENTSIWRAWDADTHWLFDADLPTDSDGERWGRPWPSISGEPTSIYALKKGSVFPVPLLANDELLSRNLSEMRLSAQKEVV